MKKDHILYSIKEASELSGLGINTINKFIELEAIIPLKKEGNNVMINSHGMYKLKEISKLLDEGLSKEKIVRKLER